MVRNSTRSEACHVARVPGNEPEISKEVQEEIGMVQLSLQESFVEPFPAHQHQMELQEGRNQEK